MSVVCNKWVGQLLTFCTSICKASLHQCRRESDEPRDITVAAVLFHAAECLFLPISQPDAIVPWIAAKGGHEAGRYHRYDNDDFNTSKVELCGTVGRDME